MSRIMNDRTPALAAEWPRRRAIDAVSVAAPGHRSLSLEREPDETDVDRDTGRHVHRKILNTIDLVRPIQGPS